MQDSKTATQNNSKKKSLLRSSLLFSVMTFISRILGLVRDIIIAKYFTNLETDAFFAAIRIPNTLRRFFAEGGFSNAFVPVLSNTKAEQPNELPSLLNHVFGALLFILLILTTLGVVFAGAILFAVAPGFSDSSEQQALAELMLRITFPYILFISIVAFLTGILNTYGKFGLPAFVPAILNISLISAALFFKSYFDPPVVALAWAVAVGGFLQMAILIPSLIKLNRLPRPQLNWQHQGVRKILKLMIPTLFGSSVGQINILLNTMLASLLASGSISWLYYSDRLVELPIAIIGVALGTVILPKLSAFKNHYHQDNFTKTLGWALKIALIFGSAAATGLFVLAEPLMATLFHRGKFTYHDVEMATRSLQAFALGAFSLSMVKVLVSGFYSRQDTKTPVKIGIFCVVINMLISLSVFKALGHSGLALASSISSTLNMILLASLLYRDKCIVLEHSFVTFIFKVIFANLIMAGGLYLILQLSSNLLNWNELSNLLRIVYLSILIVAGTLIYLLSLVILRTKLKTLLRFHD